MLRCFLLGLFALLPLAASAEAAITLNDTSSSSVVELLQAGGKLYRQPLDRSELSEQPVAAPRAPQSPSDFVAGLQPVSQVD